MTAAPTYRLRFPPDITEQQLLAALLGLAGSSSASRRAPARLRITGTHEALVHSYTPSSGSGSLGQIRAAVPGLAFEEQELATPTGKTWRLSMTSGRRPLSLDRAEISSRAVLAALASPKARDESVQLEWVLGPVQRPRVVGTKTALLAESWPTALLSASLTPPTELDGDARRALRSKLAFPGWRSVGLISAVAATPGRAQALAAPVLAALRTADAAGSRFGIRPSSNRLRARAPWRYRLLLSAPELVGLLAWPIGEAGNGLPVDQRRARLLSLPRVVSTTGRLLGRSTVGDQPVRLDATDANRHTYVLGPTGTGKSTFLISQILQDIEAGHSVVTLDAKGQLTDQILERYPQDRLDDLVVMDAAEDAPVGLNPFASRLDPALVADQMFGIFSKLYPDALGPRTSDVISASLSTLARTPGTSLASLPLLLTNDGYRRSIIGKLDDPLGTGDFWAWYDGLTPEMRQQVIAPTMNKIRPFLLRPNLRAVVGQSHPKFDLLDVFTKRRVLVADLAKGVLGPEGSGLLGTTLISLLWQTTLSRSKVAPDKLRQVSLYIDEAQDFLRLPGDIADLLAQARSLKLGLTIAHQHLAQISPDLREALLANARSRVLFQLTSADARILAPGHPELTPDDLASLPEFETYMSLVVKGGVQPYASVRTTPPEPAINDPAELRRASALRYGVPRGETEAELRTLMEQRDDASVEQIGQRPRRRS